MSASEPTSDSTVPERRAPPPPPPRSTRPAQPQITDVWTPPRTNVFAILSLGLSLFWLAGLGSVGAVVLGHMAKRQIADSKGTQTGASVATAGLVIGYIGVSILLIYIVVIAAAGLGG